ncbi:MAG: tetratricopeptide repeat protein [Candidatus Omnitrophota bacterium]|jgi:hypothetical protein
MQKKVLLPILLLISIFFFSNLVFAETTLAVNYLYDLGAAYYKQGRYEDALAEFNKVLAIDPDNKAAKTYISDIFKVQNPPPAAAVDPIDAAFALAQKQSEAKPMPTLTPKTAESTKEQAMDQTMNKLQVKENKAVYSPSKKDGKGEIKVGPVTLSGEMQLGFGVRSDDFIWKRANFDLNEKFKSWRMTSDEAFNRRFNTYDPAIYDSLSVNVDTNNKEGFNFHTNVTVDPWSFTGKSDKFTVSGVNGDIAKLQMFYWSNTGYVVNHTAFTSRMGDTINIPELKVKDGVTSALTTTSNRNKTTFNIPAQKINREFQPVRELWADYANDQVKLRTFALGYQDQAYSSDDPMGISNHGIWWKDSKWLRQYTPGIFNSGTAPASFVKGKWDDSLSFLSKDSTGKYLTGLRGFAFNFQSQEQTYFDTTVATPKHLWQDYGNVDNVISASRLKHYLADNFMLGGTFTSRFGFLTDQDNKLDSQNLVGGFDVSYEPLSGVKLQGEALTSKSNYDMSNSTYKTDSQGNAYYFSVISRYPQKDIMDLKYGYDEISMDKEESFLIKGKFYASRMDPNFDSALSDYHNTRQDVFWSRHIHFRKPMDYYTQGLNGSTTNWDELNSTRIGDGIDIGRNVLGFRFETFFESGLYNLFDVRNVHSVKGKFIENVARDEATLKVTDKLTAKALGIYQKLPDTTAGIDPFVYNGNTGDFFTNTAVKGGDDPTIKTGSFGLNYDFCDWLSINGVYERTNDYTLGYGDFPRNVLRDDTTLTDPFFQNDNFYQDLNPFLYSQNNFPQAPYKFYNIFKTGMRIKLRDNLEAYLDYTRNEFEAASLISDNMNHVGLEIAYMPTKQMGMAFKYTYSRCQDLEDLIVGNTKMSSHNNFFTEFRYLPSKDDEFIMQYGVGDTSSIGNLSSLDPYGGSLLTLDTQHIIRAYYRRKF